MLAEPNASEWRCWNGLSAEEFAALTESRAPLEGCKCRGCVFLRAHGFKPIARAELLAHRENKDAENATYTLTEPPILSTPEAA